MISISYLSKSGRRDDWSQARIFSPRAFLTAMNLSVIPSLFLIGPIFLLSVSISFGQESVAPDNTGAQAVRAEQSTVTAPPPAPTPSIVPVEPPSIIPPNILPGLGAAALPPIPAAPEIEKLNQLFQRSSLGKAADEHRLHVQSAALETQIRNDADLHELKRVALAAATDLERRQRFRTYYERYYGKLQARADSPELKAYLKAQEAAHELTLLQPRVRHASDEAEAARLAIARRGTLAIPLSTPVQAKVNDVFGR